jgi:4-amino-4-deoxy-L-arabinose transferase-like glycosyltransferase
METSTSDTGFTGFFLQRLPPSVAQSVWARRIAAIRPDYRAAWIAVLLSSLVFIPYLGAVGLWDPWETHYGEVARQMIHRNDYVYPYWETAWFFSKPPLTMWMQALGMQLAGTERGDGVLPLYTEWCMRMPFALFSILAIGMLTLAVSRLAGTRAGLATAFILATTPMYFLLTRQTVTDTPFVTSLMCAMACALIAQLDATTRHRNVWWYGFYVFCGLGTLAKGLLGLLPAVVLMLYAAACVMPYDATSLRAHWAWLTRTKFRAEVRDGEQPMPFLWGQMQRMHLLTGIVTYFAVAAPWYVVLTCFSGVDDEGKTWFYRFIIHDHFNRLAAGVHTTTPGGNFIYFIEQAGYAFFPWVALIPGALLVAMLTRLRDPQPRQQLTAIVVLWATSSFFIVAISATKFHHYLFPVVPGVAVLMALYVDRLWEDGIAAHAGSLLAGFVLLALVAKDLSEPPINNDHGNLYGGFKNFTDLFVYNYDRPYPAELLTRPIRWFSQRPLLGGEVLAALFLAVGGYIAMEGLFGQVDAKGKRSATARAAGIGLLVLGAALMYSVGVRSTSPLWLLVGAAVVTGVVCAIEIARDSTQSLAGVFLTTAVAGLVLLVALPLALSPDHRTVETNLVLTLIQPITPRGALGSLFLLFIVVATLAALMRSRVFLFSTFSAGVLAFALWFNWSHWVSLSHHWTQRDLFWRYYAKRGPGEPIAAYLMNWKGETFYSRNQVRQIPVADTTRKLQLFVAPPGREWILVEHARLTALRSALGSERTVTTIDRDVNNKFVLVSVE